MLEHVLSVAAEKAKIAALVVAAAAVGGMAAVTISGPSSILPTGSDTTVTTTPSPEATDSPEATSSPKAASSVAVTAATTTSPAACPAGTTNHGAYVSSVARDKSTRGRAHGQAVSAAAHSDCGKPSSTTAGTQATQTKSPDPVESADPVETKSSADSTVSQQPKASNGTKHGKGRN